MQTPQEFMQSFLREKEAKNEEGYQRGIALNDKFFTKEYANYYRDWIADREPETCVSFEARDKSATVITIWTVGKQRRRFRYLLRLAGSDWQICGIEIECFVCHGTGRKGTVNCRICGGAGWKAFGPQST